MTRPATRVWVAFAAVHAGLTVLGVVVAPSASFYDVDLYRWWMYGALEQGSWPVLDGPWVYPAGALVPMLLPALVTTVSTPVYALGWCALVTALDAAAVAALLRRGRPGALAAAWWLGFLALLGPVAIGRLDAVVAPVTVLALLAAADRARVRPGAADAEAPAGGLGGWPAAAALLTAGAWIKVAPGALLLPLAAAARRPLRDVALPAAAVTGAVVAAVAAGGGLGHLTSFLATQRGRGLQVESVAATPWTLAAVVRDDVVVALNEPLVTYEVTGPGTAAAAGLLDGVLVAAVAAVAVLLVAARRRGTASAALLPAALTLVLLLVVANKVGSPQFMTWLAPPLVALLAVGASAGSRSARWSTAVPAAVALVVAALTQVVFPWGYLPLLEGDALVALALAARNGLLVVLLGLAIAALVRAARGPAGDRPAVVAARPGTAR